MTEIYPCDRDNCGDCPFGYKPCEDCKPEVIEEEEEE